MHSREKKKGRVPQELIRASGKLKKIKRAGWLFKAGIADCESVADHCFRTALLAAYYASEEGIDSGKAARMGLIHDLAESITGDKMPEQKESEEKHRLEEAGIIVSMLKSLPSRRASDLLIADAKELFEGSSKEARLVWAVDKLEMGLQQREYLKQGYDPKSLRPFGKIDGLNQHLRDTLSAYSP